MENNTNKAANAADDVSLFEQVLRERDKEEIYFDFMIDNSRDFDIALVTMPDDYIIRMHDYYVRQEAKEEYLTEEGQINEKLERMREKISKLEELAVIQEHMSKPLTEEEKEEIRNIVAYVAEKQKVRKMGPIRRKIYEMSKKKK